MKKEFGWLVCLLLSACGGEADVARPTPPALSLVGGLPVVPTAGGATLRNAEIVLVSYASEPASVVADVLRDLDGTTWLASLAEYGIANVKLVDERVIDAPPPSGVSRDEVRQLVDETRSALGRKTELVFIVYPRKTTVFLDGKTGCRAMSDHHGAVAGAPYVVLPTCGPTGALTPQQSMEVRTSRAVANAVTNPDPLDAPAYDLDSTTSAWIALGRGIGDLCPYLEHTERGHLLTRVWSNARAARDQEPCVPAPDDTPLFGVTISPDGVGTPLLGEPTTWTLTAFDLGGDAPMDLFVYPGAGTVNAKATLDRASLVRGETATLSTTLAKGAPPDTFLSFTVGARRGDVVRYRPVALYLR